MPRHAFYIFWEDTLEALTHGIVSRLLLPPTGLKRKRYLNLLSAYPKTLEFDPSVPTLEKGHVASE